MNCLVARDETSAIWLARVMSIGVFRHVTVDHDCWEITLNETKEGVHFWLYAV
jgi:hypothetical protein